MNSYFIDTNVILRYLLDDVEQLSLIAEHVINGNAWTSPEVLAEVTYVLESIYKVPRESITAALEITFNHVDVRPHEICFNAIKEYGRTKLDFVDCMAIAYGMAGSNVFTFDQALNHRMNQCL